MKIKTIISFLFIVLTGQSIAAQEQAVAIKGKLIKKTIALRDIKQIDIKESDRVFDGEGKRIWPSGIDKPNDRETRFFNQDLATYIDPLVQGNVISNEAGPHHTNASIITGIEGMATGSQPMDPSICVGRNHVIELVNGSSSSDMKIWKKDGTVAVEQIPLSQLSGHKGYGDPIALYDQWRDRYIVTEFIIKDYNNSTENGMSILVSATNDPTGAWNVYKWTIPEPITLDYPHWSVNLDGIYLHTNNYAQIGGGRFLGSFFVVFNKDQMYNGNSTFQSFRLKQKFGNAYSTCPAQLQGLSAPYDGQLFVALKGNDKITLISCDVKWSINSFQQTNAGDIELTTFNSSICNFNTYYCIPQPDHGRPVDPLSGLIMNQPIYRSLITYTGLVFSFTVNVGKNTAGIRWVELRRLPKGIWTKYQEGTWHPNKDNQFAPSIAYDAYGNIGMAYNAGSLKNYLSIKYTSRKQCDSLGIMTQPELSLKEGNSKSIGSRWGDYNHLVADPDGESLWMVAMYGRAGVTGGKGTYISRFDIPKCNAITQTNETLKIDSSNVHSNVSTAQNQKQYNVSNFSNQNIIKLSPNPTKNYLELDIPTSMLPGEYQVLDFLNRVLIKQRATSTKEMVPIAQLQQGSYFLIYNCSNTQRTILKFIKE